MKTTGRSDIGTVFNIRHSRERERERGEMERERGRERDRPYRSVGRSVGRERQSRPADNPPSLKIRADIRSIKNKFSPRNAIEGHGTERELYLMKQLPRQPWVSRSPGR